MSTHQHHDQHTPPTRGRPAPRRPGRDTVGIWPLDEAARRYAAHLGCPDHAAALAPLVHAGARGELGTLCTVAVGGESYTSIRWIDEFVRAACVWGHLHACGLRPAPAPRIGPATDGDPEDQAEPDPDPDEAPAPEAVDPDTLAPDEPPGPDDALGREEDPDAPEEDPDAPRVDPTVGGVAGQYSYTVVRSRAVRGPHVLAPAAVDALLAWLHGHHPGLFWVMEGRLRDEHSLERLAYEAGVAPSTIARYQAQAYALWQDARQGTARQDGRAARVDASRRQLIEAIRELTRTLGKPPSQRDIQAYMGKTSKHHVERHLRVLVQQGVVRRQPGGRGYIVTAESDIAPHSLQNESL